MQKLRKKEKGSPQEVIKNNLLQLVEFLASTDNLYDHIYKEDVNYRQVNKVTDYDEK